MDRKKVRKRWEQRMLEGRVRTPDDVASDWLQAENDLLAALDHIEAQERRIEDLQAAAGLVVYELCGYYFEQGDSELEALNRLRLELGLEPQKPKHERDG